MIGVAIEYDEAQREVYRKPVANTCQSNEVCYGVGSKCQTVISKWWQTAMSLVYTFKSLSIQYDCLYFYI